MADSNRTQVSMRALTLADFFNASVGDKRVSNHLVKLAAPDGPSTGGGKQALQHVSLVPDRGPSITAGAANTVEKRVELRSFEYLQQLHGQRFKGKKIPLDKVAYNELLKRMANFFAEQQMMVMLVEAPRMAQPQSRLGAGIVVFVCVALSVAGAMFFFFGK